MVEIRTYSFIDIMQPQFAAFVASTAKGYLPVARQAALYVEVAPGIEINRAIDLAVKATAVQPAVLVVERAFGLLAIHSFDQAEVREAGAAILRGVGADEKSRLRPRILSTQIITGVDDHQAVLINRQKGGSMLLGGQTLYILEVHPAGYAALAANEAEKNSPITIVDVRPFGAFGRLYLGGTEAAITEAAKAVVQALDAIDGRVESRG